MQRNTAARLTIALACLTAALGASTASAAAAAPANETCLANIDTKRISCFSDDATAQRKQAATMSSSWTVVAILYDRKDYAGNQIQLGSTGLGSDGLCSAPTSDPEGGAPSLNFGAGQNWNNRARSLVTRNQCDVKLYASENYGGAFTPFIDHSTDLSAQGMLARANSFKIS
jgi:Peptidase inhibitor family I36